MESNRKLVVLDRPIIYLHLSYEDVVLPDYCPPVFFVDQPSISLHYYRSCYRCIVANHTHCVEVLFKLIAALITMQNLKLIRNNIYR